MYLELSKLELTVAGEEDRVQEDKLGIVDADEIDGKYYIILLT